ncbi:MAG: glycosyltransferase family 1 protein [Polyangiaceae bacterium]
MPLPRVLIDATPLSTPSRTRGIGRLTYDLLVGLEAAREQWCRTLDIVALTSLSLCGKASVDDDLARAAQTLCSRGSNLGPASHWARRLGLARAVHSTSAVLIHLPELIGVPLLPCRFTATCHDLIRLAFPRYYLGFSVSKPDGYLFHQPGTLVYRRREQRRWRCAERIICVSDKTREALMSELGIPDKKIDVVLSGIDLSQWVPAQLGDLVASPASGRPYVLYVGDADYRKNISGMFGALAEVRRSADVELVWAGKLAPEVRIEIERRARVAGVHHAVRFLGFVPDEQLLTLYRNAVALLFLSRLEGFGLPAVEAMASGCPVIVALDSGTDAITASAALHVAPDDAQRSALLIERLMSDVELRKKHIAMGLDRAKDFDRARMARGYAASFERAIG